MKYNVAKALKPSTQRLVVQIINFCYVLAVRNFIVFFKMLVMVVRWVINVVTTLDDAEEDFFLLH